MDKEFDPQTLRARREARGLTQKKLAELAGISEIMIGRYESQHSKPSAKTVVKLAAALDVGTAATSRNMLIRHVFWLRPDGEVVFDLPSDLTSGEAERLANFVRSLPF